VLLGVQLQQERGDRPLQPGTGTAGHAEPGTRQLGGASEVEDAQPLTELDVVPRLEVRRRRLAPAADQLGVLVGVAVRQVVARQVRDAQHDLVQLGGQLPLLLLELLDAGLQRAGVLLQRGDVLTALGRRADLLRDPVGLRAGLVRLPDHGRALGEQLLQGDQVEGEAAARELAHGVRGGVEQ
jgi:hypothetical protein